MCGAIIAEPRSVSGDAINVRDEDAQDADILKRGGQSIDGRIVGGRDEPSQSRERSGPPPYDY
jgi:hypothetical protein